MSEIGKKSDINWVGVAELKIDQGFNCRFDYGDLEELKNSIIESGVKKALHVYRPHRPGDDKRFIVIEGHRRLKAIKMAELEGHTISIPVINESRNSDETTRIVDLVVHNSGKPLNALEEATVYQRLLKIDGWNNSKIAKAVGKSVTHVIVCISLLSVDTQLLDKIKDGRVSPTMVIEKLKTMEEEELNGKIEEAIESGVKKVTAKHIKEVKPPKKKEDTKQGNLQLEKLIFDITVLADVDNPNTWIRMEVVSAIIKHSAGKLSYEELVQEFVKD